MIIIVDSGATKADWAIVSKDGKVTKTNTLGLSPEVLKPEQIKERILASDELANLLDVDCELFFYGAGCGTQDMRQLMRDLLLSLFVRSQVVVKEDTYAAVYALVTPGTPGICAILGTGSNCVYYDGQSVQTSVPSLGYMVMDEGVGITLVGCY